MLDFTDNYLIQLQVVGNLLVVYEQAPRYAMTFTDSSYTINQYTNAMTFLFTFFNLPAYLQSSLDQDIRGSVACVHVDVRF